MESKECRVVRVEWGGRNVSGVVRVFVNYDPDLPVYTGMVVIYSEWSPYEAPWVFSLLGVEAADVRWSDDSELYYVELRKEVGESWTALFEALRPVVIERLSVLSDHIRRREAAARFLADGWDSEVQPYKV